VLVPSRFLVNAFVQLRRDREGKRQEECGEQPARDQHAKALTLLPHWPGLCGFKIFLQDFLSIGGLTSEADWTVDATWLNDATEVRHMIGAAKIYFIVFGVLTILGGIIGYASKGSVPSIIAGSIAGILLLLGALLLPNHLMAGLAIALIVSVLLAGQFVPKFIQTGKAMPAGMMSILSVIGIIAALVAWVKK
jgi:uncharacterized membrane protein (UPF0136 family)